MKILENMKKIEITNSAHTTHLQVADFAWLRYLG